MKRASDFSTRIAVWVLTIFSGLVLLWAREFIEDHRQFGVRMSIIEREVSSLTIQMDVLKHSRQNRWKEAP